MKLENRLVYLTSFFPGKSIGLENPGEEANNNGPISFLPVYVLGSVYEPGCF